MITFASFPFFLYSAITSFTYGKFNKRLILTATNLIFIFFLFFYAKKHLLIFLIFLGGNFLLIKLLEKKKNLILTSTIVIGNIFFLCFFKYDFLKDFIINIFPYASALAKPMVFMGISFFTFRLLSMVFDVYYGTQKQKIKGVDYFNYLTFFPCFLSGPIDRYHRFTSDIETVKPHSSKFYFDAVFRIVLGAFKKKVVADTLFTFCIQNYHSTEIHNLPVHKVLLSHYVYMFVLYFDFSGYSDMAIGVSNLFGIKTPENFNRPFTSRNIQEFWNRWHISLLHWLRDYIYIPVQTVIIRLGFKQFTLVACFSYLLTFFLAGVWHGGSSHYAHYGLFHGLGFTIFLLYKKFLSKLLTKHQQKVYSQNLFIKMMAIFITIHFFLASLILFIDKGEVFSVIFKGVISE